MSIKKLELKSKNSEIDKNIFNYKDNQPMIEEIIAS